MKSFKRLLFLGCLLGLILFSSCSIRQLAVDSLADMLSGSGGTVFTGDEDPELVGEALPFALKLYESLLSSTPDNEKLLLTTGTGFISYANIYVHTPSDMLPQEEYRKQREMRSRAKALYLRGRDYVLRGIDVRHPGFAAALKEKNFEEAFVGLTREDVPYLYWAAAGWLSAISFDVLDTELMITVPEAFALAIQALSLDEAWGQGSIHELLVSLYGSVPEYLLLRPVKPENGDCIENLLTAYYTGLPAGVPVSLADKGKHHYQRAVELSAGRTLSPYLSYALAFARKKEEPDEYIGLLEKALQVDPRGSEAHVLANLVNRKKALWLMDNLERYFILMETDDEW